LVGSAHNAPPCSRFHRAHSGGGLREAPTNPLGASPLRRGIRTGWVSRQPCGYIDFGFSALPCEGCSVRPRAGGGHILEANGTMVARPHSQSTEGLLAQGAAVDGLGERQQGEPTNTGARISRQLGFIAVTSNGKDCSLARRQNSSGEWQKTTMHDYGDQVHAGARVAQQLE